MSDKDYISYLGVDWGEKRVGLAIGDSSTRLASPFGVIADLGELLRVIEDEEIDALVVGVPFKMKDNKAEPDPRFSAFVSELESATDIEIIRIDERLSSKQADSLVGSKKTKASRDSIAAMLILQSHLDRL